MGYKDYPGTSFLIKLSDWIGWSNEAGLGRSLAISKMGTLEDLNKEISQRLQIHP